MEDEFTVEDIIYDLRKLGRFSEGYSSDEVPEEALFYLLLNYGAIKFCLDLVYEDISEAQRKELCENHKELDYSAIASDFYNIALNTLESAQKYFTDCFDVTKDYLNTLIRGLEYAKYKPHKIPKLFMPSKIEQRVKS